VLVHGTGGSSVRWMPVLPALEQRFSVYAVDRRGRGQSGDAAGYGIEREFEDVAAVVDAIGEPVFLLGHSYGGICALEAARLTANIRKLILYEPPTPVEGVPIYPPGAIDRLQALLDAGDRESLLATFSQEIVKMPPHQFQRLKDSPAWPARLAAAHTLPRELRAHERYRFQPDRFTTLATPTLLLLGSDSPYFFKAAIEAIAAVLPHHRLVLLPGQQHIAMDTAPELFVNEVIGFLTE
jgi:pimeloyl-ACP methyl ester carboxylesterase